MINKELFYKYTDWTTLQSIGAGWIGQLKGYLPIGQWIQSSAGYQIALWAMNIRGIPYWAIILFLVIKFYIMIFINWIIGRMAIKIGIYKAQQQYSAKTEHLSPYNVEVIKTLEAICDKLEIKSKFTKL